MENMVAIASQMTDESTEAPEIDVAHIYLRPLEWSRKSDECTVLVPMHLNLI